MAVEAANHDEAMMADLLPDIAQLPSGNPKSTRARVGVYREKLQLSAARRHPTAEQTECLVGRGRGTQSGELPRLVPRQQEPMPQSRRILMIRPWMKSFSSFTRSSS